MHNDSENHNPDKSAAARAPDSLLDSVVDGSWEITDVLGVGSMSRVYRARHLPSSKPAVIKALHKRMPTDRASIERFHLACREVMSINMEGFAKVADIQLDAEGDVLVIMQFLRGETLRESLFRQGPMKIEKAIETFAQAANSLEKLHAANMVHGDLKSSNIFLSTTAGATRVVMLDAGVLQYLERAQTRHSEPANLPDFLDDIYQMGSIMYESITRPLAPGERLFEPALFSDEQSELADLAEIRVHGLLTIMARCIAKNPADRFQSAAELAEEFDILLKKGWPGGKDRTVGGDRPARPAPGSKAKLGRVELSQPPWPFGQPGTASRWQYSGQSQRPEKTGISGQSDLARQFEWKSEERDVVRLRASEGKEANRRLPEVELNRAHDLSLPSSSAAGYSSWVGAGAPGKLVVGKKGRPSRQLIALALGLNFASLVMILAVVVLSSGAAFDEHLLWQGLDRGHQSDQPDFAGQEDSARTAMSLSERENGPQSKEYAAEVFKLADIYMNSGHFNEAIAWFDRLLQLCPQTGLSARLPEVYAQLAYANWMLHRDAAAQVAATFAMRAEPISFTIENPGAGQASRGPWLVYGAANVPSEKYLDKALKVLAYVNFSNGNLAAAENYLARLRTAMEVDPQSQPLERAEAVAMLADVYRRQGKLKEAEGCYTEALALVNIDNWSGISTPPPSCARILCGYALLLVQENRFREANFYFQKADDFVRAFEGPGVLEAAIKKQLDALRWKLGPLWALGGKK